MKIFLQTIFLLKTIWIPFFLFAQDVRQNSTYNVIKETHTTNGLIIQPGTQVRALGVIEFSEDWLQFG